MRHLTDEELVTRVRLAHGAGDAAGVQAAFCHLQYRHQDRVGWLVAAKLPGDRVEETVQDVFLALFEAAAGGREIANLRAWLNKVAANHVAEFHRRRRGQHVPLEEDVAHDGGEGLAELEAVIEAVLAGLRPNHRLAVELALFEDRPAREVAAAAGETEANVYQVVRRFRLALREALNGENSV